MTKTCIYCGAEFQKRPRNSRAEWEARKVCSRTCRPSPEARLWAQVERRGPDECWPWTGGVTSTGHGTIRSSARQSHPVHRLAYELEVGPIPEGYDLHHVCENKVCCNPAHLTPMTHGEHTRLTDGAAVFRAKTHCPAGHPYDDENTYIHSGRRMCKVCRRLASNDYKRRKKAAA